MRPSDDALAPDSAGFEPTDLTAPGGGAGLRRSRPLSRWQGVTLSVLAGAILFGACQGDNLFNGNSESFQPKIVGIAIPSHVWPGDTIQVQVSAYGPRQIARIEVSLAGAAAGDTAITLQTPSATVAQTVKVVLPYFLRDTALVIRALAYDKAGAASRMRADTARAEAVPVVYGLQGPDSIRGGQTASFLVGAAGFNRISSLRFSFKGLNRADTVVSITRPDTLVTAQLDLPVPAAALTDTVVTVLVEAVDYKNVESGWYGTRTPVVILPPTIDSVTVADTVRAGVPMDVSVRAHGLRKVNRLSFSLRRGLVRDSVVNITLPGTSISQSASFLIPGDAQDSLVTFSVSALDVGGGVSAPVSKRVTIPVGIPVIDSLITPDSIRPGTILDTRVIAHGSRPLARIDLSLRGAVNQDVSVSPVPSRTNVTQDFAIPLPDTVKDSLLVIMTKATDTGGNVSGIKSRTIKTSDTALPTVVATLVAATVPAGAAAGVRIQASDNVGLSRFGVRVFDATKLLVAGDSASASGRTRDSTFSIPIPQSGPRTLSVVGYARDRNNNEARSTPLTLTVVDSMLPVVTITQPAGNATVPIGDSLMVTVNVADMVGIKTIALSGVAIRSSATSDPVVVTRFAPRTINFPQPPSAQLGQNPTVTRYLLALPDTTAEPVNIIAVATDSLGNKGVDTVQVNMGGPRVAIRSPVNGGPALAVNMPMQLRVFAFDRTFGIDSLRLDITGAIRDSIKCGQWNSCSLVPSADSVVWTTTYTPTTAGQITINATAWNRRGIIGNAPAPVQVTVVTQGGSTDPLRPSVQIASINYRGAALLDQTRLELSDSVAVLVKAMDNGPSGVKALGLTVAALPAGAIPVVPDTVLIKFPLARTGEVDTTFYVRLRDFGLNEASAALGRALSVQLRFSAFARDGGGNCGATSRLAAYDSIPCAYAYNNTVPDTFFTAVGQGGLPKTVLLVGGRTIGLPSGGEIADAVIDAPHKQLYLSNIQQNKVDILRLADTTFVNTGSATGLGMVGSQPWGMFLSTNGDSLFVANSGSTNLSVLRLTGAQALTEALDRRIFTPNEVLFQVSSTLDNTWTRYKVEWFDFSDRPQFVAQDMHGRLVYSTVPTPSATDGTLRFVIPWTGAGQKLEPKLIFNDGAIDQTAVTITSIAYVDSIVVQRGGSADDGIVLWDHVPGFPNDPTHLLRSNFGAGTSLATAIASLKAQGSDVVAYAGAWVVNKIGMSDTTFLAVSGDRSRIAVGEGATSPTGRILVWEGSSMPIDNPSYSNEIPVRDLINNASERVFGLGLNANGSFGVARGTSGAYFFTPNDLRLQGLFLTPGSAGGAALHPNNNAPLDAVNGLAFISTPSKSIKILDSVHFFQRGEIQLRDNVVGPVKAGLPLAGENGALAPGDPNYIIVKLYCVTADASGHTSVVMVNVRNKDLTN